MITTEGKPLALLPVLLITRPFFSEGKMNLLLCRLFSEGKMDFLLCHLRSIAVHRDHFVRCLSGSHTILVVTHSCVLQATHAFI